MSATRQRHATVRFLWSFAPHAALLICFSFVWAEASFNRRWFTTSDPDATYAVSAVAIAAWDGVPKYVDHPGYPTQYAIAACLRASGFRLDHARPNALAEMPERMVDLIIFPRAVGFAMWMAAALGVIAAGQMATGSSFGAFLALCGFLGLQFFGQSFNCHPDVPCMGIIAVGTALQAFGLKNGSARAFAAGCGILGFGAGMKIPIAIAIFPGLLWAAQRNWGMAKERIDGKKSIPFPSFLFFGLIAAVVGAGISLAPFWLESSQFDAFCEFLRRSRLRPPLPGRQSAILLLAGLLTLPFLPVAWKLRNRMSDPFVGLFFLSGVVNWAVPALSGLVELSYFRFSWMLFCIPAALSLATYASSEHRRRLAPPIISAVLVLALLTNAIRRVEYLRSLESAIAQSVADMDAINPQHLPVLRTWTTRDRMTAWNIHAHLYWPDLPPLFDALADENAHPGFFVMAQSDLEFPGRWGLQVNVLKDVARRSALVRAYPAAGDSVLVYRIAPELTSILEEHPY
ncbi:MAG TPA: hypothetical protein PL033_17520 [Candidatus Brocadiia bacterium]|nr:hypothetical protein [Candidatus Brocadiia bacterium]